MPKLNQPLRNFSIRFTLWDNKTRGTQLTLPRRHVLVPAIIVGGMFVAFASVLVSQASKLDLHQVGSVPHLMGTLFSLFWLMGWSAGVVALGLLTLFLLFARESAWVAGGKLHYAMNIGPIGGVVAYELALLQNLEVEPNGSSGQARLRFDCGGRRHTLGYLMPLNVAERNANILRTAMGAVAIKPDEFASPAESAEPPEFILPAEITQRRMPLTSMLTLVAANLLPMLGVVLNGWTLEDVLVLFWAESAIIGFYTLLKIAVVAKWWAIFPGLFFTGHFGGFMAIHFMFLYQIFLRGFNATTSEPGALEAIMPLFTELWPALLALFASHGVSFVMNFIGRREYEGTKVQDLMRAPYARIFVMQITIILGGFVATISDDPLPMLVLLIAIKIVADLKAHTAERNPKNKERVPVAG
jgi:hypothetical protein